jgi:hypothetical protein
MSPTSKKKNKKPNFWSITFLVLLILISVTHFMMLSSLVTSDEKENHQHRSILLSTTTYNSNQHRDVTESLQQNSLQIPYYKHGKSKFKEQPFHHKKTFQYIQNEQPAAINEENENVWILSDPIQTPTRNHESILLEYADQQILVNVLGRYSRVVQWMDLMTGQQYQVTTTGADPDNRPLNDLNHVASVLVDIYDSSEDITTPTKKKKEIWLPCGFHNDRIGKEQSSNFVRIIDLETMQVRAGPKLPYSGGACGAALIDNPRIPNSPPFICAFGGTDGNHDTGIFLPYVSCYDRVTEKWVHPFGKLPVGMDHLSVVVVPKSVCDSSDPARVLLFNYRTKNYSTHTSAEILAFDIPDGGWTREELDTMTPDTPGKWYTFANHTFDGPSDEAYAPRDASAVVMANDGISVINFGGINQVRNHNWIKGDKSTGPKVFSTWYSTVRELNVCEHTWTKVADLGIQTFAIMAAASTKLNNAFFCGGSMYKQDFHGNTQWCLSIKIPGIKFWNHRLATNGITDFPSDFQPGKLAPTTTIATTSSVH